MLVIPELGGRDKKSSGACGSSSLTGELQANECHHLKEDGVPEAESLDYTLEHLHTDVNT